MRAISKSNSASSLIHGNNNGHVDNLTGKSAGFILPLNSNPLYHHSYFSGHHATLDTHRRAATVSPQPFTSVDRSAILAASKQAAPRILAGPVVVAAAEPATAVIAPPSAADCSMSQFQPGTYPQLKRASLTNIPIYENVDGFPAVPARGRRQATPPPPPPPYTGPHHIVPTPEQPAARDPRLVPRCRFG